MKPERVLEIWRKECGTEESQTMGDKLIEVDILAFAAAIEKELIPENSVVVPTRVIQDILDYVSAGDDVPLQAMLDELRAAAPKGGE